MKQFHGFHKTRSFFEGWYLKHGNGATAISFIPAFHLDSDGRSSVSIQIITPDYQGRALFSSQQFLVNQEYFSIRIGPNFFSRTGITVDIQLEDFHVQGSLSYGPLTPLRRDIMGPFRYVPWLQCNHGIVSLTHQLRGKLDINGVSTDFSGGTGYIEKDWGSSFPQSYLWTQGSFLSPDGSPCCVMVSIAHIPFFGIHFTGCICSVLYEGEEYRLATYHGVSILSCTPENVELKQGRYRLSVKLLRPSSRPLYAPDRGNMTRIIEESISCPVRYRLTIGNRTLFDVTVPDASFESCLSPG